MDMRPAYRPQISDNHHDKGSDNKKDRGLSMSLSNRLGIRRQRKSRSRSRSPLQRSSRRSPVSRKRRDRRYIHCIAMFPPFYLNKLIDF